MDQEEEYKHDYQKGFNQGYFTSLYLPELADKLSDIKTEHPRGIGFIDGVKQFERDQVKDHLPSWLDGKNKNPDIKIEKSKSKDIDLEKE